MSFQITFQSETLTTMTVERFLTTVQSDVSLHTDLPSECLPTDRTHKALFTTLYHNMSHKVPSDSERFWHVAPVYSLSPVCIIKFRLIALWVIKNLLHIEHRWGRSLACILEWLVKAPFCVKCTTHVWHKYSSLQYVFSHHYPNLDLLWRPPYIQSTRAYPPCVTLCAGLNPICTWKFCHADRNRTATPLYAKC